jgi:hypothetical protein
MDRFVSRRSQCGALIVLVAAVAVERTSFAQTPPLEVGAPVVLAIPAESEEASPPQPAPRATLDPLRVLGTSKPSVFVRSAPIDAAQPFASRVFVECHISRHPLLGLRAGELACPLLFAEADPMAPALDAEGSTAVPTPSAHAD